MLDQSCRFVWLKLAKILHYFFAHGNKSIATFQEIGSKGFISWSFFMWNYIVCYANNTGMLIFSYSSQNIPQCGPHQGNPEPDNNDIRSFFSQPVTNLYPVKWMDGINYCLN